MYLVLTFEALQRIITFLFVTDKEAITVQKVRPSHVYGIESVAASFTHRLAGGPTGPQHLLLLTARSQHRAAKHSDLGVALPTEKRLNHAHEEILGARLCVFTGLVAEDVWEHGLSVGHVIAVGE